MSKDNFAVGLVKYICPICGKVAEENIIMNQRLTQKEAEKIKEVDGKVVGYSENACEECSSHKDEVIYVIEIDAKKSEPGNPYRTGMVWGLKPDFDLFTQYPEYILTTKNGVKFCFIDIEFAIKIGLHNNLN